MALKLRVTKRDAVRGGVAGAQGVALRSAAHALFEAGGRALLPGTLQRLVRGAVENEAARLLAGVGMLQSTATTTARLLEGRAASAAAIHTARAAGRQILRGVSASAGAGAIVDGGWALVQAMRRVRAGTMTNKEAASHVAREASTGAAAAAAGTAAAALLVTLTGGIATPAVFVVGAAASLGAKAGLDAWLAARGRGQIRAQLETA